MQGKKLLEYLSDKLQTPICTLEGLLRIGGKSQELIYRRLAACTMLDQLISENYGIQQSYDIVAAEFGYTERYVKMMRAKFPHHFYTFTCTNNEE